MIIVFAQIGLFTAKSMGTKKDRFPYGLAIFFLLSQSKKKQPNRKQKQEKQEQNGRKKEYMKAFYLSGSLLHSRATGGAYSLILLQNRDKERRDSDPKSPAFRSEKSVYRTPKVHLRALWLPICPLKKKVHVSRNSHSAPF